MRASASALPRVYVQNSAELGGRAVAATGTREGRVAPPLLTDELEGFSIDYDEDWERAEELVRRGEASLPAIDRRPYPYAPRP